MLRAFGSVYVGFDWNLELWFVNVHLRPALQFRAALAAVVDGMPSLVTALGISNDPGAGGGTT